MKITKEVHSASYVEFWSGAADTVKYLTDGEIEVIFSPKITKEVNTASDFEFWSGAADTVKYLTDGEIEVIFSYLEDCYPDGMTETELNEFFWFERDTIAEWLGYDDFDQIMNR